MEFKSSTPDVVKVMIFKFSKSEKNQEKNKTNDHLAQYIEDMEHRNRHGKKKESGYEDFKLPSLSQDDINEEDRSAA